MQISSKMLTDEGVLADFLPDEIVRWIYASL